MSPLHPALASTPTQPTLDTLQAPTPTVDTSRIPPGLHHGGAKPRTCPRCGTWILTATVPHHVDVDPHALPTPQLEYAATILGRATYTLHGTPGRYHLDNRTHPGDPSLPMVIPAPRAVVLATHDCHHPPLGTTPVQLHPTPAHPIDGPPPF